MRSATSFFDKTLFRSQLKHTWPLWLGYTALWLFLVPVMLFSELSAYQGGYCSATSFLRNWDSILEKKRANLRSISEPARLRQPPPEARDRHTQEGRLKAYGRSDE